MPTVVDVSLIKGAGSWLASVFPAGPFEPPPFEEMPLIEERARATQSAGRMPLWDGYRKVLRDGQPAWGSGKRTSDQVRTRAETGACFHHLVRQLRPEAMIEIGTAFGVSGMFWLAGIESNGKGRLYTFDPNPVWREFALENLAAIGSRYVSTLGTYEEASDSVLPPGLSIDAGFVDGIHTAEFVYAQVEMVRRRLRKGGILILDDIRFSADMYECWSDLSGREDVVGSLELGRRVGLIEYA